MPHFKSLNAVLLCAIAAALLLPAAAAAGPHSHSSAIVSLGDSFISGEGGRWLGNSSNESGNHDGTDRAAYGCSADGCEHDAALVYGDTDASGCDRSDLAPIKSSAISVDVRFNLACSGAHAKNLWRDSHGGEALNGETPQADQLRRIARARDVRMVVLTVGANDFGFGELAAKCAALWVATSDEHPRKCAEDAQDHLREARRRVERQLAKTMNEVRSVMRRSGYEQRQYRLLVMGYASPIPRGSRFRYSERGWARGRCPFWSSDATWAASQATPYINGSLRSATHDAGGSFLDISHSLDGHQLCDRDTKRVTAERPASEGMSEWIRQLGGVCCQGRLRESLHPNAYGQRELGRCLALAYQRGGTGDLSCRRSAETIASSYLVGAQSRRSTASSAASASFSTVLPNAFEDSSGSPYWPPM